MKRVIFAAVVVTALTFVGPAGAGWAGSQYEKSDCTYSKETKQLFCEATFTHEEFATEDRAIPDESCPSGTRIVRRVGWRVDTWVSWDLYDGRVPHESIAGNDSLPVTTWRDFTDTPLGCV